MAIELIGQLLWPHQTTSPGISLTNDQLVTLNGSRQLRHTLLSYPSLAPAAQVNIRIVIQDLNQLIPGRIAIREALDIFLDTLTESLLTQDSHQHLHNDR